MDESRSQSVLHAAGGSPAELLHELGLVLYIGAALIFVVVMALAVYGVLGPQKRVHASRWVIGGGVVFPIVTLSALLVYALLAGHALAPSRAGDALKVQVVGKQWWWEIRYARGDGAAIVLANELHLPQGQPVLVELSTTDVIHSFWAPSLAGKVDMAPGRTTHVMLQSDEPGVWRGQCAEYCGGQHARMAFHVVVEPQAQFDAWLAAQARAASAPTDPFLQLGYDMFFRGECQECHTVRGTPAAGEDGPDLTHIGSRRSLGAGLLRNHIGGMGGWIAATQDLKPGNPMPSMNVYSGRELRALAAWLESLE